MNGSAATRSVLNPDRTIHGTADIHGRLWDIVRYDRSGKWYLEVRDGTERLHVGVRHAARLAAGGGYTPGLPGGAIFDRLVRDRREGRLRDAS